MKFRTRLFNIRQAIEKKLAPTVLKIEIALLKVARPVYTWLGSQFIRVATKKIPLHVFKFVRNFNSGVRMNSGGGPDGSDASVKYCDHRKGGYSVRGAAPRGGIVDYNVSLHTFSNGKARVRCNKCGKRWFRGDADWADAVRMVEQSSNSPSSSEIALGPLYRERDDKKVTVVFQDKDGIPG